MPTIKNIGTYELNGRNLTCNFDVSADEFNSKFSGILNNYSGDVRDELFEAINNPGKEIRLSRKTRPDIEELLDRIREEAERLGSSEIMEADSTISHGFDEEERQEEDIAEEMKSESATSTEIYYDDKDSSTEAIETYDRTTGRKEGDLILGEKGATGELVPLEIKEILKAEFEHNAEEPKEEGREIIGEFKITNPSEKDKIWDIDISFKKEEDKEIKWIGYKESEDGELVEEEISEPIHITILDPKQTRIYEYNIPEFPKPPLQITEFISTLNNEEIESYSLAPGTTNTVLFKITAKNTGEYPLKSIKITKEIGEKFLNTQVVEGEAELEADGMVWTIDELGPEEERILKVTVDIETSGDEVKARTGKITAEYTAENTVSGLQIDKFDAYSTNFVGVEAIQKEDDPDVYECRLIFENKSDFQVKLVNLDITEEGKPDEKIIDIDPGEIPTIASGAKWISVPWETKTEDGFEPMFRKKVEFFLVSEHLVSTVGTFSIEDVELAVAMLKGYIYYSVAELPSYRETSFDALMEVKNDGSAELNELIMIENIPAGYIPPKPEDIEIYIKRPEGGGEGEEEAPEEESEFEGEEDEEFDKEQEDKWKDLGDLIRIEPEQIEIEPLDQDPEHEHKLTIKLENLVESPIGFFEPGMIIRAKYPITAFKPPKDTEYVSDIKYIANTLPKGTPIELVPDTVRIPIIHIRRKIIKGKTIRALPEPHMYEITLTIENMGDTAIENVKVQDLVDKNTFEYGNFSLEPAEYSEYGGKDKLIWVIDRIEPNDSYEITYQITGKGDYRVSDNQLSI